FSSRRRHTRFSRDWSSDVCSSDLVPRAITPRDIGILFRTKEGHQEFEKALDRQDVPSYVYKGLGFFEADEIKDVLALLRFLAARSEERRVGKECRSRWGPCDETEK